MKACLVAAAVVGLLGGVGCKNADAASTSASSSQQRGTATPAGASKTATLRVEKMMCQSCAARIRETLSKVDGVTRVEAMPAEKRVVVSYDSAKTDVTKLIAELKTAGFGAEEVQS